MNSRGKRAEASLERLRERQCEIGCHGFNHDAKWPLLSGPAFEARLDTVKRFAAQWEMRGFRSEWLWRTPDFLKRLAPVFDYDSSVPSHSPYFSAPCGNGSATAFPYFTWGDMLELPLTLPMDDVRHFVGLAPRPFWDLQADQAERIADRGGLIHLSLHPQPHQAANPETLSAFEKALERLTDRGDLWLATPAEVAGWTMAGVSTSREGRRSGEAKREAS